MDEIINLDKVTSVLLQHGEWFEVDPGTLTSIPATNFFVGSLRSECLCLGESRCPSGVPLQCARARALFNLNEPRTRPSHVAPRVSRKWHWSPSRAARSVKARSQPLTTTDDSAKVVETDR